MKQSDLARALLAEHRAATNRAQELVGDLNAEQLAWRPAEPLGAWGIAQVLEHTILADDSYFGGMRSAIAKATVRGDAGSCDWRPKLGGRILVWALRHPRKLPAPKMFQVGPAARANVFAEFLVRRSTIIELFEQAREVEWRRAGLSSPESSLVRMNLGDAFGVLVAHEVRHLGQIERIRGQVGFPS